MHLCDSEIVKITFYNGNTEIPRSPSEKMKGNFKQIINYIENEAEILITNEKLYNPDGCGITKKKYGLILIETLCEELKKHFGITD